MWQFDVFGLRRVDDDAAGDHLVRVQPRAQQEAEGADVPGLRTFFGFAKCDKFDSKDVSALGSGLIKRHYSADIWLGWVMAFLLYKHSFDRIYKAYKLPSNLRGSGEKLEFTEVEKNKIRMTSNTRMSPPESIRENGQKSDQNDKLNI